MKKILKGGILLIFLLFCFQTVYSVCLDDDGIDYFYPAWVYYNGLYYDDYCYEYYDPLYENYLVEYVCDGSSLDAHLIDCTDYGPNYICYDSTVGNYGYCLDTTSVCYDSDGFNNFSKGYVEMDYIKTYDSCVGGGTELMQERYCDGLSLATYLVDCEDYGSYECVDGACIVTVDYSCVDSDGGLNYPVKGTVTLYLNGVFDDNFTDQCFDIDTLREGVTTNCELGLINFVEYDCPETCYQGECVPNMRPTIYNVTSYRYESSYPYLFHHAWYAQGDKIIWKVNATDYESDSVFVAVDCDVNTGPPYVSDWGSSNQKNTTFYNCTYNNTGVYTARIYVTDQDNWEDYSNFVASVVHVRECVTYHDCETGEWCSDIGLCYLPSNVTNCTDTDGGINYTLKGTLTTPVTTKTDNCYNGFYIDEYYCSPSEPGGYTYNRVSCKTFGSNWVCYDGICSNTTGTISVTFNVRDLETSASLSGIEYTIVKVIGYQEVASGTVSGGTVTVSLQPGYEYQVYFEDPAGNYKDWIDFHWYLVTTQNVYMEKHCTSASCVYQEYFSYTDEPSYHGWQSTAHFEVVYNSEYGFMGHFDLDESESERYIKFSDPTGNIVTIEYMLLLDDTPPSGMWVYLTDIDHDNLWVMRHIIDAFGTGRVYYWTYPDGWKQITLTEPILTTTASTTKLVWNVLSRNMDVYIDAQSTGSYILYISDYPVLTDATNEFERLGFDPDSPSYANVSLYIDNIEIFQSDISERDDEREYDPRDPSGEDLDQPWYRDAEGDLHFDADKCSGWKSYIMCALVKFSVLQLANLVSWIFTGLHLLYIIMILLIIIIVGPLIVELLRKK